jgi:hypothetical protein
VILADRAGKHHPDQVGRKDCLTVRPGRQRPHSQQAQQQEFRFQLGRAIAIEPEKPRGDPGKHDEDHNAGAEENQCFDRERSEDKPERDHRPEIGYETGSQDGLAILRGIEPELQHHGIDDGDRGGGHRNAGKPARHRIPAKQVMGRSRTPQKGEEETGESDRGGLFPFEPEHLRIKFRSREKSQHDRAKAG